ncbi:hypothetical protein [Mesorhizobium waimense]|uniref:hypothetical protein n=1 Tax=Mesorhizobium waimense TaxID=1300307 RepID=UPI000E76E193|nr:hypothetical protein [Mesorhizobium waimense]
MRTELAGKRTSKAGVPTEFSVQFKSGAFLAVLAWWIAESASLLPAQVDDLFQQMAAIGIGSV